MDLRHFFLNYVQFLEKVSVKSEPCEKVVETLKEPDDEKPKVEVSQEVASPVKQVKVNARRPSSVKDPAIVPVASSISSSISSSKSQLPTVSAPVVKFKKRSQEMEENILKSFLENGIDREDIEFLKKAYDNLDMKFLESMSNFLFYINLIDLVAKKNIIKNILFWF